MDRKPGEYKRQEIFYLKIYMKGALTNGKFRLPGTAAGSH